MASSFLDKFDRRVLAVFYLSRLTEIDRLC